MIFKLSFIFLIFQIIIKLNANPYGPQKSEHVRFEELNQTTTQTIILTQNTTKHQEKVNAVEKASTLIVTNNITIVKDLNFIEQNKTLESSNFTNVTIVSADEIVFNSLLNTTLKDVVEFDDENFLNASRNDSNLNLTINLTNVTSNSVFNFFTSFKIVSFEYSNTKRPLEKLSGIEQLIKHAILKTFGPKNGNIDVELKSNNSRIIFDSIWPNKAMLPIYFNVAIKSPFSLSEDQFQSSLIEFAINGQKCSLSNNETSVRCSTFKQKDPNSLLRLSDYWIELNHLAASAEKLNAIESEIFTYKPAWIVGLSIIGCIIAIFFLGCIIAICYTRRPYRKSGKIYEIESAVRKNKNNQVPNIPGIHPGTKTSTVTKTKEMYYE